MLLALNAIAADKASPSDETMSKTKHVLGYVASSPDTILSFSASSMVLNVHSDILYLIEPKARNRADWQFVNV